MKTAIELITEERQRQIDVYGYTDEHIKNSPVDYIEDELAKAAAAYALPDYIREDQTIVLFGETVPWFFAWSDEYWKPTPNDRIKELSKAGAMIVAEITRLQNL